MSFKKVLGLIFAYFLSFTLSKASSLDKVCLEEAELEYQGLSLSQLKNGNIQGRTVRDYKDNIKAVKKALRGIDLSDEKYASCDDALCLLEKATGSREIALRTTAIYKEGYTLKLKNSYPNHDPREIIWEPETVRNIHHALHLLPKKHRPTSAVLKNFGSIVGSSNYFHQGARHISLLPNAQTGTILHEIGHAMSMNNFFGDIFGLRIFRGGNSRFTYSAAYKADKGVATYGFNPSKEEDYANSFAYYVLDGEEMATTAPNRYKFMKKRVFKGKTFKNRDTEIMKNLMTKEIKERFLFNCFNEVAIIKHRAMADRNNHWQGYTDGAEAPLACLKSSLLLITKQLKSSEQKRMYCFAGDKGLQRNVQKVLKPMLDEILLKDFGELENRSGLEKFRYFRDLFHASEAFADFDAHYLEKLARLLASKKFF